MNDSLYDDVVDERSCAKLCGYPLCSNPPSEKLSGQKFHISTKLNKVFDVTDRKVPSCCSKTRSFNFFW